MRSRSQPLFRIPGSTGRTAHFGRAQRHAKSPSGHARRGDGCRLARAGCAAQHTRVRRLGLAACRGCKASLGSTPRPCHSPHAGNWLGSGTMTAMSEPASARRSEGREFYLWMAGAFLLIAFGGFLPTYWMPVAAGTFHRPPIVHIHGLLFFAWTCFFFAQTALVAAGRTPDHRTWGL